MRTVTSFLSLLLVAVILASCSLQKRNYLSGYYLSWKKQSSEVKTLHSRNNIRIAKQIESIDKIETQLVKSAESPKTRMTILPVHRTTVHVPDPCDTLVLENGTEIKAKVIEISKYEVKYKYCNNPNGPTIIVEKNDVRMIRYANSEKEEFTKANAAVVANHEVVSHDVKRLSVTSLAFGIASYIILYFGLITAIIAIVKGRRALKMMGKDAINTSSYKEARAGLILGIIYCALIGLILLLILAAGVLFAGM